MSVHKRLVVAALNLQKILSPIFLSYRDNSIYVFWSTVIQTIEAHTLFARNIKAFSFWAHKTLQWFKHSHCCVQTKLRILQIMTCGTDSVKNVTPKDSIDASLQFEHLGNLLQSILYSSHFYYLLS